MKPAVKAAMITFFLIQFLGMLNVGLKDYFPQWGAINFWGAIITLFIGIVLVCFKSTLDYGRGVLVASGILLVIGFATCTVGL